MKSTWRAPKLYLDRIDIIFDVLIDDKHIFIISLHIFLCDSAKRYIYVFQQMF